MATDDQSDPTRSGSRWEPAPDAAPAPGDDASTGPAADPAADPAATWVDQPAGPERAPRSWRERRLGFPVAAAVAAGLVVASGVGGFALGAIATGDDLTPVGVRVGDGDGLPGLPGDDHDGDGDGPLNGLPGQPDRDQVPPGLGDLTPPDLDGDDDDHGDDGDDDGDDDDGSDDDADEDTGALT